MIMVLLKDFGGGGWEGTEVRGSRRLKLVGNP